MERQLVLLDQDGGIDDFLSTALLLTMPEWETLGVVVTPADCLIEPAVSTTRKLLDLMGRTDLCVARSRVRGLNPFPPEWQFHAFVINNFPVINMQTQIHTPLVAEPGEQWMVQLLRDAPEPVTILETGPLTTVAEALRIDPAIETKIRRIIWMGGALNVPGNVLRVQVPTHDGTAEWNAFWDPEAIQQVWETTIPVILCPLDITNNVPVTAGFIRRLGEQRHFPLSEFAAYCYAFCSLGDYFFWDVLTTAYLGRPDLFTTRKYETSVITDGPSEGRIKIEPGGRPVTALDTVDVDGFYNYILQQWAC